MQLLSIDPSALHVLIPYSYNEVWDYYENEELTQKAQALARIDSLTGAVIDVLEAIAEEQPLNNKRLRILNEAYICHLSEIIDNERAYAARIRAKAVRRSTSDLRPSASICG